jgi:hypothetical protein
VTVFREIKVKIVAKFREIIPKVPFKGKKLGFHENYGTLLLITHRFLFIFNSVTHLLISCA